jgi:hypothetical protein
MYQRNLILQFPPRIVQWKSVGMIFLYSFPVYDVIKGIIFLLILIFGFPFYKIIPDFKKAYVL